MNAKSNTLTAVIFFIAGILLIIFNERINLLAWVSILIGVTFIIPSAYSLYVSLTAKGDSTTKTQLSIMSVAGLVMGLCMCIFPNVFAGIFVYLFAALLIIGGIYHILIISYMSRPLVLPGYLYIIPALMILSGVIILFTSLREINSAVVLITGIALVLSAINTMLEYRSRRALLKSSGRQ